MRQTTRFLYRLQGTGLPRLAESIRKQTARIARSKGRAAHAWIDDFCGDLRFRCDLSEHMGSQIFFRGAYSGDQLLLLKRLLGRNSVFVDVGANQGEFTICAAAMVPDGAVHAFEPVSALRKRLQINIDANGFQNITIYPVGLSDQKRDDVPIYGSSGPFVDGTENSGLPTLYNVEHRTHELERINLRTLDACLQANQTHVDLIKIDVEGAELSVLRGSENVIHTSKPYIIFEANEETAYAAGHNVTDICDWLKERQYRLLQIGLNGELFELGEGQNFSNILATPQEKTLPGWVS